MILASAVMMHRKKYSRKKYRRVQLKVGKVSLGRLLVIMVDSADNGTPDDNQLINTVAGCVFEQWQTGNELTTNSLGAIVIASLLHTATPQCHNCHKTSTITNENFIQHQ